MTDSTSTIVTGAAPNDLANAIAAAIDAAVDGGLDLDVAACVVAGVAADYARAEYGERYLEALADVIRLRAGMPLPGRVN